MALIYAACCAVPINTMPAEHPSVKYAPLCGTTLVAGSLIPASASGPFGKGNRCSPNLSSGEFFYAYGYPLASTGNPGYLEAEAIMLAAQRRSLPDLHLQTPSVTRR